MTPYSVLLWRDKNDLSSAIPGVSGDSAEDAGMKAIALAKEDAAKHGLDWENYGYVYVKGETK